MEEPCTDAMVRVLLAIWCICCKVQVVGNPPEQKLSTGKPQEEEEEGRRSVSGSGSRSAGTEQIILCALILRWFKRLHIVSRVQPRARAGQPVTA